MGCFSLKALAISRRRRRRRQRCSSGAEKNTSNVNNKNSASNSASSNSSPRVYGPASDKVKLVDEVLPESSQRPLPAKQGKLGNLGWPPFKRNEVEDFYKITHESAGQQSMGMSTDALQMCPPIAHQIDNKTTPSASDLLFTVHNTSQTPQVIASANSAAAKYQQSPWLTSRSEHFEKFEEALKKKLKDDELQVVFSRDYSGPSEKPSDIRHIVYNAVESLRLMVEKNPTDKTKQILVVLDKAAKIGDVAIQHHANVVALVWAGLRLLLQVAIDNLELKELVEDTMEIVARALETCGFYETIYISTRNKLNSIAKLGDAIAELYAAVVVFNIRAKKHVEESNIGKSIKRTLTSTNMELRSLADEIEAKALVLHNFASMVNTEDQQQSLEQLSSVVKKIQNSQEATLEDKQEETLRNCRIWLGGVSRDLEYEKNRNLHVTGTCQWVLDSEPFKAWMIGEVDTLLVYGMPGAGKSVFQSFILERLKELRSKNPLSHGPILYFFFKNGNSTTESPVRMMATLIDQLVQQHQSPQFVELLNAARKKSNTQRCEDFIQLWNLFMQLVNAYSIEESPRISILLDALDECSNREELLRYIALPSLGVKFLLTSRSDNDIVNAFTSCTTNSCKCCTSTSIIQLVGEQVNRDIIYFVEDQITRKYHQLQQFKQKIVETVPRKAEGMFRYAALVLEELVNPLTKDVEETLTSIPRGLYNIYIWILDHLPVGDNRQHLLLRKIVFTWVTLSFRPITVYEMALAFAACDHDKSKTEFDPANKILVNKQQILRACGPLVEITPENTIAFTHFSVKEFLLAERWQHRSLNNNSPSQLVVECLIYDTRIGHGTILNICMTQLLSNTFLGSLTNRDEIYSIRYWFEHAVHINDSNSNEDEISLWPAVYEFLFSSKGYFFSWLRCFPSNQSSLSHTPLYYDFKVEENLRVDPIHVMAAFGFQIPLKKAIKSTNSVLKMDLNMHDKKGRSPLYYAAREGHIEIVKLLLERAVDIDSEDSYQNRPLSAATWRGHTEIVKLLLERGANIDSKNSRGGTLLISLIMEGVDKLAKMLLECGAETDRRDSEKRTPLSWAAERSSIEIVKLLLEKRAEIDSEDTRQRTPLSHAAEAGHAETVKLLLERRAEIDSEDINQRTPLSYAAETGHAETVKLLLENGANIASKDIKQKTPLSYAAASWGNTASKAVKLLLENGANIDSKDIERKTPLSCAAGASWSNTETIKLLLENGADIGSKDSAQRTPLSYAAAQGNAEVVKSLLEGGAELDTKDSDQRTPLSYAADRGTRKDYSRGPRIVEMLLKNGAEIESKDSIQRTPLSYAAAKGYSKSVQLLLENGAEIDSKDNIQRTPLSYAAGSFCTNTKTIKLLLENGAEIDSKDTNQRTPLCHAAWRGPETIKLLLENGAEIDSKDSIQRTPLSYAAGADWSHTNTIKLFLENGAEIDSKDSIQRTPLSYAAGAQCRDTGTIKLLLENGADIGSKDSTQRTPLSYAAAQGRAEAVKLLLQRGAELEAKDKDGRTPLEWARINNCTEVVELLSEYRKLSELCKDGVYE